MPVPAIGQPSPEAEPAPDLSPPHAADVVPIHEPVQPAMPLHVRERAMDAPPHLSPDDDDLTDLQHRIRETSSSTASTRERSAYTVAWLEEEVGFRGAEAFVEKHGVVAVQTALREYARIRERGAPIRSPSGLLHWLVSQGEQPCQE